MVFELNIRNVAGSVPFWQACKSRVVGAGGTAYATKSDYTPCSTFTANDANLNALNTDLGGCPCKIIASRSALDYNRSSLHPCLF